MDIGRKDTPLGFEAAVVKDAPAARHRELGAGYRAALLTFVFVASAVLATDDAITALG